MSKIAESKKLLSNQPSLSKKDQEFKNILRTEKLGEGAFGAVYKGFNKAAGQIDSTLPNVLAIKVVDMSALNKNKKAEIMEKLRKECGNLSKLNKNPYIVKYYGFLEDLNEASIFMEYMPCGTLQSMYRDFGPFDELMVKQFAK